MAKPFPAVVASSVHGEKFYKEYEEACTIIDLSPKSSAALCRRLMEAMLRSNFNKEYEDLKGKLKKPDTQFVSLGHLLVVLVGKKGAEVKHPDLDSSLRPRLRHLQKYGNFAAHLSSATENESLVTAVPQTAEIVDVDDDEAAYCIDVVEDLFRFFYEEPAMTKKMTERLDSK